MNLPELPWIAEARKHVGQKEIKGAKHNTRIVAWLESLKAWWKDDETPWCGVFIAHCLQKSGYSKAKNVGDFGKIYPKNWFRAKDYLNYGRKLHAPAYGCVAVKSRVGGGHVCFVVGRDETTRKLVCLGGNQSDSVCFALYNEGDFEAFMWYGASDRPDQRRFTLPILTGVTANKVTEK